MDDFLHIIEAAKARRQAAGLAIPYVREDGRADVRYTVDVADRTRFLTICAVRGRTVNYPDYDRKALLAAEYARVIGYDPFADDPSVSEDEIARALIDHAAEARASA